MLFLIQITWVWRKRKDGRVRFSSMVSRRLLKFAGGIKRVKFYIVSQVRVARSRNVFLQQTRHQYYRMPETITVCAHVGVVVNGHRAYHPEIR